MWYVFSFLKLLVHVLIWLFPFLFLLSFYWYWLGIEVDSSPKRGCAKKKITRDLPNEEKKPSRVVTFWARQHITITDISFLTKIADMSRFMSRFVIFSNGRESWRKSHDSGQKHHESWFFSSLWPLVLGLLVVVYKIPYSSCIFNTVGVPQ